MEPLHLIPPSWLATLREVAAVLLPGDAPSPAAQDVPDLDGLLAAAVRAIGRERRELELALRALPDHPDWAALEALDRDDPDVFDVLSCTVAGAYFMSPVVLDSLAYPHGPRTAPRADLAADEIGSGVLDPVLARPSTVRTADA